MLSKHFASMIFVLLELGGNLIDSFLAHFLVLVIIENTTNILIFVDRKSLLISPSAIVC